MVAKVPVSQDRIAEFCRKWHVQEFSLFGSVLRDDFRPDSDIDVLVAVEAGHMPSLEDWLAMEDELTEMFHREVDLVERRQIENPFRRHHILTHRQVLYAA